MGILDLGRYKGIVFAITGFLVFIAIILAVNHGKAGQFSEDVSAVKFLAEQREQPGAVYAAGVELAARLNKGEKIDEPLEALRKAAKSYDNALSSLAGGGMVTDSAGDVFVVEALLNDKAQADARQRHEACGTHTRRSSIRCCGSPARRTRRLKRRRPLPRRHRRSKQRRFRSARAAAACRRRCRISTSTPPLRTRSFAP